MKAIILAAGQSKRMKSSIRKTLQPLCGKPVVTYITDACREAGVTDITLVISPDDEQTKQLYAKTQGLKIHFVVQPEPRRGTGHAVQAAFENDGYINADGDGVLVLCGDMPLLTADFLREMIAFFRRNSCAAVVTAVHWEDNTDFGHIFADAYGNFQQNIEARDLRQEHGTTPLRNTGCYIFNGAALKYGLSQLTADNAQKEFYLTDVPMHIRNNGQSVKVLVSADPHVNFTGINTHAQLAEAAFHMRRRINVRHMANGVRMIDPAAAYIDAAVRIAPDVVLYPGVVLEGACEIESGARILAHSVLTDARVGANTQIGPFAYLRPGAVIGENCRIGNFVEIKNAEIGNKTNAAHLTYVGDAEVGSHVNIGCGVITANYDGVNKYRTTIKDNVFIGSNTSLIAPVEVEDGAYIAAGSTINEKVPADSFAIARARQVVKTDWKGDPRKHGKKA